MQRNCAFCGKSFQAQRPTAKYCSGSCRANMSVSKPKQDVPVVAPVVDGPTPGLVEAVRAELEAAERLNSVLGQHALELANRIVSAPGMNAGVASLSKELSRVMGEALASSTVVADPLDELRARRDRKRQAAG